MRETLRGAPVRYMVFLRLFPIVRCLSKSRGWSGPQSKLFGGKYRWSESRREWNYAGIWQLWRSTDRRTTSNHAKATIESSRNVRAAKTKTKKLVRQWMLLLRVSDEWKNGFVTKKYEMRKMKMVASQPCQGEIWRIATKTWCGTAKYERIIATDHKYEAAERKISQFRSGESGIRKMFWLTGRYIQFAFISVKIMAATSAKFHGGFWNPSKTSLPRLRIKMFSSQNFFQKNKHQSGKYV